MAYNVLKGNVQFINSDSGSIESMVDDYSNQTIGGTKTFSQMITASLGISSSAYHGDGSGLSGLDVAVTTYDNPVANTVIVAKAANNISGAVGLTYNGAVLAVTGNISASVNVSGSGFYGSAVGLTSIPTTQFVGTISAADLTLGNGVENDSNNLAIKLSNSSGLSLTTNGLGVSPNNAIGIVGGLASADEFLVADNNVSNELRKATITNLQTYMQDNLNFGGAAGSQHQIQFRDGAGSFAASSDLTFNDSTDILNVTGKITASIHVSSSQVFATSFYGDGSNLTNLPATQLSGNIAASNISIGDGLFNDSGFVAVSASYGLTASVNGLEVTASSTSGLDVTPTIGGIAISPSRTTAKASPVTGDVILIGDSADSNRVKNTSLTNVVTLVKNNGAAGLNTQVQFNSSNAFAGDNTFTFNSATNTLAVQEVSSSGNVSASFFYGDGSNLQNVGGQSSFTIFSSSFTISSSYDVLGVNTSGSVVTGSLLAANSYSAGQRLVFKDIAGSASVNNIVVEVSGTQQLDGVSGASLKITANNGSATIVSDGVSNFYIIGTN
jgi:hypothetical protein